MVAYVALSLVAHPYRVKFAEVAAFDHTYETVGRWAAANAGDSSS
jgi:hypothetical protein